MNTKSFHHLGVKKTYEVLKTSRSGLSKQEAAIRLARNGPNKLPEEKNFSMTRLFLNQLKNPLIYILIVAFVISIITLHAVDAWIILIVLLISTSVGFMQEYKANKALDALKQLVRYKTKVIRSDIEMVIAREELVCGDIILLTAGDRIPADARLIEGHNFKVIEAALTGESIPSNKKIEVLPPQTPLADRENMLYLGTVVSKGNGKAVVFATGQNTQLGQIASLVKHTEDEKTPLQKQLNHFGKVIAIILIGINTLIFGLGVAIGKSFFDMFLTSVAVLVAAVPEGLLPALTVILAVGMQRLARRKGLVRKLLAAETLGSISVICVDKTGTLTQGEMRVSQIITHQGQFSIDGGYKASTFQSALEPSHIRALKIGRLCNNAFIENPQAQCKDWKVVGDPTEKALLIAAEIAGFLKRDLEKNQLKIAEIPFDSEHKFMATLHKTPNGGVVYAKGAPEKILNFSSFVDLDGHSEQLTEQRKKQFQSQYEQLTSLGLRVIAVAYKRERDLIKPDEFNKNDLQDFIFVGFIGLKDPLRPGTRQAIKHCQHAGIRPVIITGDHKLTAMAIVMELGIDVAPDTILEGQDLDAISDAQLREQVKRIVIFARTEPKHKLRIVQALQDNAEVVAMTGDGINDAPALKKADIGVAVGSGADVAKETADLVLLDDNFKTIVKAIERGRVTFNSIRKVVLYLLTGSFTELTLVGFSVIFGLPLPLLPAQILWNKLIEDTTPAMALAFDDVDEDVMQESPRKKFEPILNRQLKKLIVFYAIIMDAILFAMFYYFWKTSEDIDYARTMTFVNLGFASLFNIYAVRGLKRSILQIDPFSNRLLNFTTLAGIVLFLVAIYMPFFNAILHTVPLALEDWLVLVSYAMFSIVVYEVGKKLTIIKITNT